MELTQQVREYAAANNLTSVDALKEGMKSKSDEFKQAGEIYVPQP
jgi:phosphomethylpyrimidine synthase